MSLVNVTRQQVIIPGTNFDHIHSLRHFFNYEAVEQRIYAEHQHSPATFQAYSRDLPIFLGYIWELGDLLPTPDIMAQYVAMHRDRGIKDRTIDRYLAPVRKFCRYLSDQPLNFHSISDASQMFNLIEAQKAIRSASEYKIKSIDAVTYESALMSHGTRLSLIQARELVRSINRDDLRGKRDYAVFVLGFHSLLRLSELTRLKLAHFSQDEQDKDTYKIRVIGKGRNITPVPCAAHAYRALIDWRDSYNAALPSESDPRYITDESPVWRPLQPYVNVPTEYKDDLFKVDSMGQSICISSQSIGQIITTRAKEYDHTLNLSPHDMRRTAAYLAYMNGFDLKEIQVMLRHKSVKTTEIYIGDIKDYSRSNLAKKFIID